MVIVFVHANVQKIAILINIARWQILVINLYNVSVESKTYISKIFLIATSLLMIASSFFALYGTFENIDSTLQYFLGNFTNGYIINAGIILAYLYNYLKLKNHYDSIEYQYARFISSYEKEQMSETLRALRIFFSAICQCFLYRIIQRIIYDQYSEQWAIAENTDMQTVVMTIFYFSEMIMIVGICISIRTSIETAQHQGHGQASTAVNGASGRTRSDVISGIGLLETDRERTSSLNRMS